MKVTIEIPDRIGWALTNHAEARHTSLSKMITGLVLKVFTPTASGSAPTNRDRVVTEWSKGAPDPVIAHRVGIPVDAVRAIRRNLNLQHHKFRREQWVHELSPSHGGGSWPHAAPSAF